MTRSDFATREGSQPRPATHPRHSGSEATAGLSNKTQPDRDWPRRRLQKPEPSRAGLPARGTVTPTEFRIASGDGTLIWVLILVHTLVEIGEMLPHGHQIWMIGRKRPS